MAVVSIQRVKRTRAYEEIVKQLTDMIQRGELQPGDRLPPERDLAESFGVGRPTVRQALTVLAKAGVLDVLPGSGVYLKKPISGSEPGEAGNAMAMLLLAENPGLYDILELRVGIEGEAAYLAAQRRTPEQVKQLQALFHDLEEAYRGSGLSSQEDYRFHAMIAEATGNPVFVKVMISLADLFIQQLVQTTQSLYHEPDRVLTMRREHEAILTAIVEQRPEDARLAMVKHLRRVSERMRRLESKE